MRATLAILMAGRSSRFGRPKALEPIGPSGEALFEYAVHDALRAGLERIVFVARPGDEMFLATQLRARLGRGVPFEIVLQKAEDVPEGFRAPPGREKPWGTGHAVLALGRAVREPFVVANADDFYGATAIPKLVRRIKDARTTGDPSHFLAGYELRDTPASASGGVNRAVCAVDAALCLQEIVEMFDIRADSDGWRGRTEEGDERRMAPEVLSSMNLWAFQPSILEALKGAFARFHAGLEDPLEEEFRISTAVNELVGTGRVRVRVVPIEERAYGMTFPEDRAAVVSGVAQAVASGHYPTELRAWFERRRGSTPA